jgi:photosystem II stability/assembly factor-like uncharacterized protein
MHRHGWLALVLLANGLSAGVAREIETSPTFRSPRTAPMPAVASPLHDDAQLHDVHFVTARIGWAVGDHGVIWHTRDGGETWSLQNSGVECPLYCVQFLTDRYGWVAGGGTTPFTMRSYGVLLATTDGGATWQPLLAAPQGEQKKNDNRLPRLHRVKFFSLESGVVAGDSSSISGTGVWLTDNGGRSWQPVQGPAGPGWRAADFLSEEIGAVAGARGVLGLVVEGNLHPPRIANLGLRGLHDLQLTGGGAGWLVGDGGLVLSTDSNGLVWEVPHGTLPPETRRLFDFHTVACRGERVWVAGTPGSVVWHSPDAGKTWRKQSTGQPLYFLNESVGWGVGALGTVVRTTDGGATWLVLRGDERRVALLTLHASPRQISLAAIAELSGESGYRSLVHVLPRQDVGAYGNAAAEFDVRLSEAVTRAGGSAGFMSWQFPLSTPGLERDAERLLTDWNRRLEDRFPEVLAGHLARQLRVWRPSVIVVDPPSETDAVSRVLFEKVISAIEDAGDATRFLEQSELADLRPWQVERLFVRLPDGSTGQAHVDAHQYLPRLGRTAGVAAADAAGLLAAEPQAGSLRQAYRMISLTARTAELPGSGGFFAGLPIPPGSAARRDLTVIDETDLQNRMRLARRQRDFEAYTDRFLDDARQAGQLIAQLSETVHGMPEEQGALVLARLAERYFSIGRTDLAELTLVELAEKYPNQPSALRAMQQLVRMWSSAEVTWRRLQATSSEQRRHAPDIAQTSRRIELAAARLTKQLSRLEDQGVFADPDPPEVPESPEVRTADYNSAGYTARKELAVKTRFWQSQALRMAEVLRQKDPGAFEATDIQLPLAAVYRRRATYNKSDEIFRRLISSGGASTAARLAEGELWLNDPTRPPTTAVLPCSPTERRPLLDGVLSDDCWQDAMETTLRRSPADKPGAPGQPLVMLCRDEKYLYFGASVPRIDGMRTDGPVDRPRQYDEDLADFDRISLIIDVDRDYTTYFSLTIDQRGCTNDACWGDATWNPRWYVAADGDDTHWRVEVAIPLEELSPEPPATGGAWGVGILRTIPAVGVQSWTLPAAAIPNLESFGLLKFE